MSDEETPAQSQAVLDGWWGQAITEERQAQLDVLAEQQFAWANQQERSEGPPLGESISLALMYFGWQLVLWLAQREIWNVW